MFLGLGEGYGSFTSHELTQLDARLFATRASASNYTTATYSLAAAELGRTVSARLVLNTCIPSSKWSSRTEV